MITQTPWIERKFNFDFPVGLFPVIIERLRGAIPRLEALVFGLNEEIAQKRTGKNWSIKEQIGHLTDLEELWSGRIDDFLDSLETLRAADMTNERTFAADHHSQNLQKLLNDFIITRSDLVRKVESFDEKTASKIALHPRLNTPMRLVDSLFFVAEHDDHHLAKIRALRKEYMPDK